MRRTIRKPATATYLLALGLFALTTAGPALATNGTRDETFSEVRFGTLTPTLAYAINDDLSIGASFNLGYADNPFGPGARVDHSQWTVSFGVSWAMDL